MAPLGRYLTVALLLVLLLAGTFALRTWHLDRVVEREAEVQTEVVARAQRIVAEELEALQSDLLRRAERLAGTDAVRLALQGDSASQAEAVAHFAALDLPDGYAAELYSPTPELVAWQGSSLPLDPATRTTRFLAITQTAIANDADLRQALVVWLPVRDGRRVLGAVRTLRLLRTQVPVRNQYLRDFDLAERWQRRAGIPLTVHFDPLPRADSTARVVRGFDGTPIAVVEVQPPPVALLRDTLQRHYDDALAFWGVLGLGWLVFGLGQMLHAAVRRAVLDRTGRRWGEAFAALLGASVAWIGVRYALLGVAAPARWFGGLEVPIGEATGVSVLFDPVYLASGVGGGVLGSAGDLAVTAGFAIVLGVAWCAFGVLAARHAQGEAEQSGPGWALRAVLGTGAALGVVAVTALLVRRATLDATLPYFDRTGPLPEPFVLFVFGAILLLVLSALLVLVGLGALVRVDGARYVKGAILSAAALLLAYTFTSLGDGLPWWTAAAFLGIAGWGAWRTGQDLDTWAWPLTLRGVIVTVLVVAGLTYPIVFQAVRDKRSAQIVDVADEFADGEDARVAFALEGVLLDARASEPVRAAFERIGEATPSDSGGRVALFDSLATDLVTGSLLVSLADYTIGLVLLMASGDSLGSYQETLPPGADPRLFGTLASVPGDPLAFRSLRSRYAVDLAPGFSVEREAAPEGQGKFRYAGLGPIRRERDAAILGWVMARAEPKPARYASETPFPRVLVPAGLPSLAESDLALAEFQDGALIRSRGDDFGRFRLPTSVETGLRTRDALWQREQVGERPVRVYYRRLDAAGTRVVAVREGEVAFFDHLYSFLRLLLSGFGLGLVAYVVGIAVRRRAGVLARRSRLRDRVLNRFLAVGIASVALTGLVGQAVIVEQNRQAVEDRLKRRLGRIEAALYAEANPEGRGGPVPLVRVLDRARPDVVGPREGLDVNLYRGYELVASSRSQLVRQQLIDRRLPIEVYEKLFIEGERYAFSEEHIGTFTYTTGYEALPDDDGRTGAVIAIPTLPEQIAIESDQARMIAYLFGVLLLLLVGIFFITTLLANRLTQPFRRLRQGLLAVGAGEALSEPIPVESSDEIGELIETFNAMHSQLEASRRALAQQERELAWREMAQQVAHEIKNPLTPMKLSVQHLRRAHDAEPGPEGRFAALLDRITGTLIEQIDALTRIANEFSTFARLPRRHLEALDLNAVIREAAALSGEEEHAALALDLTAEPLPLRADREELRRVYINLFKNALQAMPAERRGTITVRTERRADEEGRVWAWSAVRDNGTGIPEDAREKVFQPNFSTKTSGMGLGLAISKKAVEDLRGTIAFETELGVGTTFFIQLPLAEPGTDDSASALPPARGAA